MSAATRSPLAPASQSATCISGASSPDDERNAFGVAQLGTSAQVADCAACGFANRQSCREVHAAARVAVGDDIAAAAALPAFQELDSIPEGIEDV